MSRSLRPSFRLLTAIVLAIEVCLLGDFVSRAKGQGRQSPGGADSPAAIAEPIVNNTALDTAVNDTQSGTAITLGSGSNVIVAFNNSRFGLSGNHFVGWGTSANGGTNWTDRGSLPASASGDGGYPSLAYDRTLNRAYLASLCSVTSSCLQIFRSDDNGVTWGIPAVGAPGFTGGDTVDKPWIAVDNAAGTGQGYVYAMFRNFTGSGGGARPNGMYVCRSTDAGATYGPNGCLQLTANSSSNGAWIGTGPDHAVYAVWHETSLIKMRKSTDLGVTFAPEVTVTTLVNTAANGSLGLNGGFRTNSFPQAAVNPATGHAYVVYNDITGGADKSNVYVRVSTDGATWNAAVKINDDITTNDQFFPTIAVTPDGSRIFASWYDRRSDPANSRIERWGAIGTVSSGVITWGANFPISNASFPVVIGQDPIVSSTYMSDYDQSVADNNFFYTTWGDNRLSTSLHTNQPDVRFAKIPVAGPSPILKYVSSSLATLDPAACNSIYVTLRNFGYSAATGVSATLSTSAPGVVIEQATANYPDIPGGGTRANATPFRIRFTSAFVCATDVPLTLTVTSGGETFIVPFTLGSKFNV